MTTPVYKNYSQAELDLQYNTHRLVPEVSAYRTKWSQSSAQVRRTHPNCVIDVPYGNLPAERLDIFPPRTTPSAVQIFFHGGYWARSDKLYYSFVAQALARRGILVVTVNYPLCPAVGMAELLDSCRRAVVWTWRNAAGFGGDPGRLFISGHSAGAHIVATLATTDWARDFQLPTDVIKGVTAISGLYDLEPVRLCSSNTMIGLTPQDTARFSPTTLPLGESRPSFIVAVGGLESNEFRCQSTDYARHLTDAGASCELMTVAGHHHYSVFDALCNHRHPLGAAVLRQAGCA